MISSEIQECLTNAECQVWEPAFGRFPWRGCSVVRLWSRETSPPHLLEQVPPGSFHQLHLISFYTVLLFPLLCNRTAYYIFKNWECRLKLTFHERRWSQRPFATDHWNVPGATSSFPLPAFSENLSGKSMFASQPQERICLLTLSCEPKVTQTVSGPVGIRTGPFW